MEFFLRFAAIFYVSVYVLKKFMKSNKLTCVTLRDGMYRPNC